MTAPAILKEANNYIFQKYRHFPPNMLAVPCFSLLTFLTRPVLVSTRLGEHFNKYMFQKCWHLLKNKKHVGNRNLLKC